MRCVFLTLCVALVVSLATLPIPMKVAPESEPDVVRLVLPDTTPTCIEILTREQNPIGLRLRDGIDLRLGRQTNKTNNAVRAMRSDEFGSTTVNISRAGEHGGIEARFDDVQSLLVHPLRLNRVDAFFVLDTSNLARPDPLGEFADQIARIVGRDVRRIDTAEIPLWFYGERGPRAVAAAQIICEHATIVIAQTEQNPEVLRIALIGTVAD